jgi:hypothetical protein
MNYHDLILGILIGSSAELLIIFASRWLWDRYLWLRWFSLILFGISLLFLGCSEPAGPANSGEWKFTKTGGISENEHVVTVVGHGKTCYVFVEDSSGKNAAALLWCE